MATIEFHCPKCDELIRADSAHAGQRGKCSGCHQDVYIPTPDQDLEPLKLSPVDVVDEREQTRLLRETQELRHRILHDRESPADKGRAGSARPTAAAPSGATPQHVSAPRPEAVSSSEMEGLVISYATSMAKGDLSRAEELAARIRTNMRAAENIMQSLTVDELPPPALAAIPRPVLAGFFRQLRDNK